MSRVAKREPAKEIEYPYELAELLSYNKSTKKWEFDQIQPTKLQGIFRGDTIKVVSWNIKSDNEMQAMRTELAIDHLAKIFTSKPKSLMVMLQEVRQLSFETILEHPWVKENLKVTEKKYYERREPGNIRSGGLFTMVLFSKDLPVRHCFRVALESKKDRDALIVDIMIKTKKIQNYSQEKSKCEKECFRLCTVHMEGMSDKDNFRECQLEKISSLLKGANSFGCQIVAGLVGGDMNMYSKKQHELHLTQKIDLKDVWEDEPRKKPARLMRDDPTYGRAKGYTFGYQSDECRNLGRLDKFYYTGKMCTVKPENAQDVEGKQGRIGIDVKTTVNCWSRKIEKLERKRRNSPFRRTIETEFRISKKKPKHILLKHGRGTEWKRTDRHVYASDHFGITIGAQVL